MNLTLLGGAGSLIRVFSFNKYHLLSVQHHCEALGGTHREEGRVAALMDYLISGDNVLVNCEQSLRDESLHS